MSEEAKPIETEFTPLPVCPYCGHEVSDAWEYRNDEFEHECSNCEKRFTVTRDLDVTYCTFKIDEKSER